MMMIIMIAHVVPLTMASVLMSPGVTTSAIASLSLVRSTTLSPSASGSDFELATRRKVVRRSPFASMTPIPTPTPMTTDALALVRTLSGSDRVHTDGSLRVLKKVMIYDYQSWHRRHRACKGTRRLVFKLRGAQPGLGDRFTALLAGYIHAVASSRLYLVDWMEPFPLRDALAPRNINVFWQAKDQQHHTDNQSIDACDGGYCTRRVMKSKAHTLYYNVGHPYHVVDVLNALRAYGNKKMRRRLASVKKETLRGDATLFAAVFNTLFRPTQTFATFMMQRAGPLVTRGDYIATHARLGSGVSEGGPRFDRIDHECVARTLLRAARKWQGQVCARDIFLATDTPTFRDIFHRLAESERVGDVLYGDWDTKHLSHMTRKDESDRELFYLSLLELVLIGRGKAIIGMGSRFADVGGFFGGRDANIVIGLNGECSTRVLGAHQHIWQQRRDNLLSASQSTNPNK